MEAIVSARKLKEQVAGLQGILAKKETIPILSRIKIEANDEGDLVMSATDLDVSLTASQEVDVLSSGSICLSGKKLASLSASLPDEPVHLKLDRKGEKLEFRAGRFLSRLAGTGSEQFPEIVRAGGERVEVPASVFYEALRCTVFAAGTDQKRFTINGVLLLIEEGELKMVSTDGARLCIFRAAFAGDLSFKCLIPIKAARELVKIISSEIRQEKGAVVKVKKGSQLEFEIGNKIMTARELAGEFPNWEMVVPKNFVCFAEINVKALADALARVACFAEDVHRRVEFRFFSEKVELRSESAETGFSTEEVGCTFRFLENAGNEEATDSEGWKIAFNIVYLLDFLSIHSKDQDDLRLIFKFGKADSQAKLGFEGGEKMYSYILVPLRD